MNKPTLYLYYPTEMDELLKNAGFSHIKRMRPMITITHHVRKITPLFMNA
jgi:hypothetical protein